MNKKLINAIEDWCSNHTIVIPFNLELMQVNFIDKSNYKSYGLTGNLNPDEEILGHLGSPNASLIPQLWDKLDEASTKLILELDPTFVVWMGEDSMSQMIGNPKLSESIYKGSDGDMEFKYILDNQNNKVGLYIKQFAWGGNESLGLFPLKSWKLARIYGTHDTRSEIRFECKYEDLIKDNGLSGKDEYGDDISYNKTMIAYLSEVLNVSTNN